MQSIRKSYKTSHKNKEVKPVEPVQMKIYWNNTYKKDLN